MLNKSPYDLCNNLSHWYYGVTDLFSLSTRVPTSHTLPLSRKSPSTIEDGVGKPWSTVPFQNIFEFQWSFYVERILMGSFLCVTLTTMLHVLEWTRRPGNLIKGSMRWFCFGWFALWVPINDIYMAIYIMSIF